MASVNPTINANIIGETMRDYKHDQTFVDNNFELHPKIK